MDNVRVLASSDVAQTVKELFIKANHILPPCVGSSLAAAKQKESHALAASVLGVLEDNIAVAERLDVPVCQDTGMAIVFAEVGKDIYLTGKTLNEAIDDGVREAYLEGKLRCSVVRDPFFDRTNTGDNTPAITYIRYCEGDKLKLTALPKGFGSENMSAIKMLKPADGVDGVLDFVVNTVKNAGPNPCPPIVVGVGIGGTFEKAAQLSKFALMRDVGSHNEDERYAKLEEELMARINALQIGPAGLGGSTTALGVHVEWFPTHIAGLPVAVNLCCHAYRHSSVTL